MGSKGSQTVQQNTNQSQTYLPDPQGYGAISGALQQAQNVAQTPFSTPQAPVAGFSPQQQQAFDITGQAQGYAQPFINQAQQYFSPQGTQDFLNPYTANVSANLQDIFGQQMSQTTGQLTQAAGGVGADRIGVGQAQLAKQQGLAAGQTFAGLYNNAAQQAQTAGFGVANLGTAGQNAQLQGAQALLGTGGLQQQLQQAQLNAPYQQQLQQIAWPYQNAQFNANVTGALAPGLGGTTTGIGGGGTTYPGASPWGSIAGLGLTGLGVYGMGQKQGWWGGGGSNPSDTMGPSDPEAMPAQARGGRINPYGYAGGGATDDSGGDGVPNMASAGDPMLRMIEANQLDASGRSAPVGGPIQLPSGVNGRPIDQPPGLIPTDKIAAIQPHIPQLNMQAPQQQSGGGGKGGGMGDVASAAMKILPMVLALKRGGAVHYADGGATDEPQGFMTRRSARAPRDYDFDATGYDAGADRRPMPPTQPKYFNMEASPNIEDRRGDSQAIDKMLRFTTGYDRARWGEVMERMGPDLQDFFAGRSRRGDQMAHQIPYSPLGREAGIDNIGSAIPHARGGSVNPYFADGGTPDDHIAEMFGDLTPAARIAATMDKSPAARISDTFDSFRAPPRDTPTMQRIAEGFGDMGRPGPANPATQNRLQDYGASLPDYGGSGAAAPHMADIPMPRPRPDGAPTDVAEGEGGGERLPSRAAPAQGGINPYGDGLQPPAPERPNRDHGFVDSPWAALLSAGLGTLAAAGTRDARGLPTPALAAIGQGGQQGLKTLEGQRAASQKQQTIEQEAQKLDQAARFHRDQYTKMTPYQEFEASKPFIVGQNYFGLPIYARRDPKSGQMVNALTGAPLDEKNMAGERGLGDGGETTGAASAVPGAPQLDPTVLQHLPSGLANTVKAIDEGRQSITTVPAKMRGQVLSYLNAYDPEWDQTTWAARNKMQGDLSTNGNAGKLLLAVNQLLPHLKTLSDRADKLDNGNFRPLNAVENYFKTMAGDEKVKAFNEVREVAALDAARLLRGSGQMAEADINHWRELLSSSDSPRQLHTNIAQLADDLMEARVNSIAHQYRTVMHREPPELVSKEAKEALDVVKRRAPKTEGGGHGGGHGEAAPPAPAAPAAAEKIEPADRFNQLRAGGLSKADAYKKMHEEGY